MNERGAAGVVLIALVAVALAMSIVVSDVGGYLAARLSAASAADAAALAAAPLTFSDFGGGAPQTAAAEVAAANGARLLECRCPVDRTWSPRRVDVVVGTEVRLMLFGLHEIRERSAAEFDPRKVVAP